MARARYRQTPKAPSRKPPAQDAELNWHASAASANAAAWPDPSHKPEYLPVYST